MCVWCWHETTQDPTPTDCRRAYVDAWEAALEHVAGICTNEWEVPVPCTGCPVNVRAAAADRVRYLAHVQAELGMRQDYGLPMYDSVGCPAMLEQRADSYDAVVGLDVNGIGVLHDYTVAKILTGDFCREDGGGYQIKMWNGTSDPVSWLHYWPHETVQRWLSQPGSVVVQGEIDADGLVKHHMEMMLFCRGADPPLTPAQPFQVSTFTIEIPGKRTLGLSVAYSLVNILDSDSSKGGSERGEDADRECMTSQDSLRDPLAQLPIQPQHPDDELDEDRDSFITWLNSHPEESWWKAYTRITENRGHFPTSVRLATLDLRVKLAEHSPSGAHWRDVVWRQSGCGDVGLEHVAEIAAHFFSADKYDYERMRVDQENSCPPDREPREWIEY